MSSFTLLKNVYDYVLSAFSSLTIDHQKQLDFEQRQRDNIGRLPNEVLMDITKHLSGGDCARCMYVCKSWFARFFGVTYNQIEFTDRHQIQSFNWIVQYAATQFPDVTILTVSVAKVAFKGNALSCERVNGFSDFWKIINVCQNIVTLTISWQQLYLFVGVRKNRILQHLGQLRHLHIRKVAMPYPQPWSVSVPQFPVYSRYATSTSSSSTFIEQWKYIQQLVNHTPMLESLTVAFNNGSRWVSEENLDTISRLCSHLQHLHLENAALFVAGEIAHGRVSEQQRLYSAEQMKLQHLHLKKPVFYNSQQLNSFYRYLTHAYSKLSTLTMYEVRLLNETPSASITDSTTATSAWTTDLKQLTVKGIRTEEVSSFCDMMIREIGLNSSFTQLNIGGAYKNPRKVRTITVDVAWILQACPHLRLLTMSYVALYCSGEQGDDLSLRNASGCLFRQGDIFNHLALERQSSTSAWQVQSSNQLSK
ncbi:hypothetical protein BDB00DRAFT_875065 [Zychaea mexicana]|uniref:uncharacterized protein n=1 Tax=Zychaea mexicana TaxID=64656 RepID=UPI0022FE1501|nr:uncharacterized protein BDB00DRAFT_875065 [Zychaea mexicana]KAI9490736.1 hypothetical protein BDB00DRAFT_875065 [Zychaea mexicana]